MKRFVTILLLLFFTIPPGFAAAEVDFDTEVIPILSKAGCNSAACHGGAAGRGGFRLSLFGSDTDADYRWMVRELEGRRVNLGQPAASLLIAKPTGLLDHGGEVRIESGGPLASTLENWIAEGAHRLQLRKCIALEIEPRDIVLSNTPAEIQLQVTALFDDNSSRDVTDLAVYETNDAASVEVSGQGKLRISKGGHHTLIVRFLGHAAAVSVTSPLWEEPIAVDMPRGNWIDDEISSTLQLLRIPPSPQVDDAGFLRRIRLDLTGRLPTPEEVFAFLHDPSSDKRERMVDQLLESKDFVEYWTFRFARLLRVSPKPKETKAAEVFYDWLRLQIESGRPLDQMSHDLLTTLGDTHVKGPANFHRVAATARDQAEYASQVLMGVRLRCANCHNHPLDRWTQDDYHGFAAIFARLERGRHVQRMERGEVTHPRTGQAAVRRIPGERYLDERQDGLDAVAKWITGADNPYFARAMVGRLWKAMLGRGLVEPVDDLRVTNPPTHPVLLRRLSEDFVAHGYQIRHTLRLIANSAVYARSCTTQPRNASDDRFYSHALIRPLEAEVIVDALADVTGVFDSFADHPLGTRSLTLIDPSTESRSLDVLGRCVDLGACESETRSSGGLASKLHLINGRLLNEKLASPEGRLRKLIVEGRAPRDIIVEFYVRAFGRNPDNEELDHWLSEITDDDPASRNGRLEDFVWSLLSCREFMTNH